MIGLTLDRIFTPEGQQSREFAHEIEDAISKGRGAGARKAGVSEKMARGFWAVGELHPFGPERRDRRLHENPARSNRAAAGGRKSAAGSAHARGAESCRILLGAGDRSITSVQIVTDAGVELTGRNIGAFFYNDQWRLGESYLLYTISGVPIDAFSKFPMPRNTGSLLPLSRGTASCDPRTSRKTQIRPQSSLSWDAGRTFGGA